VQSLEHRTLDNAGHDVTADPSLIPGGHMAELGASVVSLAPGELVSRIREGYLSDASCEPLLACPEKYGYTLVDDLLMRHADRSILVPDVPVCVRQLLLSATMP
jgi:hypothetical protein